MNYVNNYSKYITFKIRNSYIFTLTIMLNLNNKNMKKLSFYLMIMVLSLTVVPTTTYATEKNPVTAAAPKEVPAEVKTMLNRLEEIKKMDKSSLSSAEKKSLRKEVRTIKSSLKSSGNGVYLSVGAIIIIILLLVILL